MLLSPASLISEKRLERLCRYVTRPAICLERLSTDAAGKVIYELKHPFPYGITHILFTPENLLARLAALVPRPRANLTVRQVAQRESCWIGWGEGMGDWGEGVRQWHTFGTFSCRSVPPCTQGTR